MNNIDRLIKNLEEQLKANSEGLKSLNELVTFIGTLENQMSTQDVEINRLRNNLSDASWESEHLKEFYNNNYRGDWR